MTVAETSGYIAAALVFATFYMKTMVPLRIVAICSNLAFITYGVLDDLHPVLILHAVLLPLNVVRLYQMLQITRDVREAAKGDLNADWLKPFASTLQLAAGQIVFRKGDVADDMFVVVSGRYRLVESGITIAPPDLVGELAFLAPERRRTQSLECVETGTLLRVGFNQVEQLYFQNPSFGFFLLKLIARRLFENIDRLESELARRQNAKAT